MDLSQLTPRRPYLLRAFYEWLLDNQLTPHLVVDVTLPGVQVPMEYARDGQIVLNIAPRAVGNLELANDEVRFNARFGGIPRQVSVPLAAVLAIYARENGAGTMFEPEAAYDEDTSIMNDEEASQTTKPLCRLLMATSQITMMTLILTMNLRSHHAVVDRHYAL
ncbi:ClpXP protease specificity-enhancing factor [Escherichia coli]|uniref:Stringent starvation protein B n=1 Tax=Escherichia coli TaxID=562 RepID=A0A2X1LBT5_ECOLX|nr:ClpXP protease specificity-enhancing factor [Escherichia coli]